MILLSAVVHIHLYISLHFCIFQRRSGDHHSWCHHVYPSRVRDLLNPGLPGRQSGKGRGGRHQTRQGKPYRALKNPEYRSFVSFRNFFSSFLFYCTTQTERFTAKLCNYYLQMSLEIRTIFFSLYTGKILTFLLHLSHGVKGMNMSKFFRCTEM